MRYKTLLRIEGGLTYTQVFDMENRLASVTVSGQTTQFVYDGDGNLVKKVNPDGSKTIYVGGIYSIPLGDEVDKSSRGSVTHTRVYYPVGGAMRVDGTLYYVLKDHLGSASVVTDASGNIVGENRYYPFGETRLTTGSILTDKLYTGQREITGLGIYHYGARFYSQKLGRFLSADTIIPGYANPQNLNRFSYVRNNPLRYTDPTGHMIDDGCSDYGCGSTTPIDYDYDPGDDGNGGNNNEDSDGGDPEEDDPALGHEYTVTTVVCPAVYACSYQEMILYLSLYAYPGQDPWSPVQDLHTYTVDPFAWFPDGSYINSGGKILVDISNGGLTSTNISLPTHLFHEGEVVRTLSLDVDGNWSVTTVGTGTNDTPVAGLFIDIFNDKIGGIAFEILDMQMKNTIKEHHLSP